MNQIFKVIWKQSTQSWVAVSELTKAHKKQSVSEFSSSAQESAVKFSNIFFKLSALGLALLAGSNMAHAAGNVPQGTAADANSVAAGDTARALAANAVAVGKDTLAANTATIAVGLEAIAAGENSIAIGNTGTNTVAKQPKTRAGGANAIAIGNAANTNKDNAIAVGKSSSALGTSSVAIGENATVKADYTGDQVDPNDALKSTGTAMNTNAGIAIGKDTSVIGANSIAIGLNSKIGFGQNAVALGQNLTLGNTTHYSIGIGSNLEVNGVHNIILGSAGSSIKGDNAVAIGRTAKVNSGQGIAVGDHAYSEGKGVAVGLETVSHVDSVAIGRQATVGKKGEKLDVSVEGVAIGYRANTQSQQGIAIGRDATTTVDGAGAISIGQNSYGKGAYTQAIGTLSQAETNSALAFGYAARVSGEYSAALGREAYSTAKGSAALGAFSYANTEGGKTGHDMAKDRTNTYATLTGSTLTSSKEFVNNGFSIPTGAISIGSDQEIIQTRTYKAGEKEFTYTTTIKPFTRQLTGLAAGTKDTDAVNVAQLRSVSLQVAGDSRVEGKKADGSASDTTKNPDLLLETGRLDVKGDATTFTTTEAKQDGLNAIITVKNKIVTLSNTQIGTGDDATPTGSITVPTEDGLTTAKNVAEMINKSGFNLKTSAKVGEKVSGTKDEGELINPGATVEMVAGKNMSVKQDDKGKVTYATKDDVEFNTVKIANPNGATYTDKNNNPLVKADDGKFYPADQVENGKVKDPAKATPVDADKVTTKAAPSVEFKAEKATPATNNTGKDKDGKTVEPTTALNISSDDGKPTQLKGVGSVLNTTAVPTALEGTKDGKTATPEAEQPKLVNLEGKKDPKTGKVEPLSDETLNSAATVRDIANMGWVVSTKDGNGYKDVVKNANQVDFKGGAGISVKGTTTTDGVREITISVKDGEVIKPNQFTAKVNGTDTPVTKVGNQYYNTADIDPKTGKPNAKANPVTPDAGTTPTNAGDGYVTGNKVATAIQKSGFVVGKQTEKLSAADFNDKDEKVNPDDELRFADGNNTKVKLATKESVDKDGNKVTTTTLKVDVTGLPVQYTDKNGTPVTKVGDKYFTVDDKGNPTATEVKPADLTTNMVNPAAAPNVIGAPTALGNVKSNLPSVNDADKNAKDVAGNPIAGKDNKSAPITATEAADLFNPKTADGKANPKFAGNNAATVSDVLNTGWNLQNNGEAKDFVKPYDTVNFVDGKGTKAVVETTPNGTTSNVKFDIDTGSITNNADGSVQGPVVTPEMTKALEDATNALNSLPPTAPAAVIDAAKKAVADAANNIANVANKVATAQDVANAINKSGFTLSTSANGGEKISGTPEMINPGKKVEMVAGKNMTVKQESNGKVTYATASNVTFDSVQFGDKGPKITNKAGNINVSGPDGKTPTKIIGVAPGEISATSKDAINGSQLHAVASNLNNKINKVGKRGDAGTASALAAANIPQAYTPGKSLVGIAAGSYQGQNGLAVGMSRISDNGKIIIRLSGTANSQGKTGVAAGVGYQW